MHKTSAANSLEVIGPKARISEELLRIFNGFEGKDEEYISKKIAENMEEILFVTDSPNCTKIFRENIGPCPGIDGGYISAICTKRAIEYDSNMDKLKPLLKKYKPLLDAAEKTHVEQTSGNSQPEA